MSGVPGNPLTCILYLNPASKSFFLTAISGLVSLDLIRDMMKERLDGVTLSINRVYYKINITFKVFLLIWLVEIVMLFGELVKVIFNFDL